MTVRRDPARIVRLLRLHQIEAVPARLTTLAPSSSAEVATRLVSSRVASRSVCSGDEPGHGGPHACHVCPRGATQPASTANCHGATVAAPKPTTAPATETARSRNRAEEVAIRSATVGPGSGRRGDPALKTPHRPSDP